MSNARKPSRAVAGLRPAPGPVTARLLTVGALGSAAAMMALSAGGPAATAAASHAPAVTAATLTADVQQPPPAGAQPPASSSTFSSVSDFFSAAGVRIQNASSAVSDWFNNGMATQGQAQIDAAQGQFVFSQTAPYWLPIVNDTMKADGDSGLVIGTMIGSMFGAPGIGLEAGVAAGGGEGVLRGLIMAPEQIPPEAVQNAVDQFNSILYPAGPPAASPGAADLGASALGATGQGTGFPQGLASELGLAPGGAGLGLGQGDGTAATSWPAVSSPGLQQGGTQNSTEPQDPADAGTQSGLDTGVVVAGDPGSPAGDGGDPDPMVSVPDPSYATA